MHSINQVEILQLVISPILYTAYFWFLFTILMILLCVVSKVTESIREDWKHLQLRGTYQECYATNQSDLRRIAKQYHLDTEGDLPATVYAFYRDCVAA